MGEALDVEALGPVVGPAGQHRPDLHTPLRPDAYTTAIQDRNTYYTTEEVAKHLGTGYRTIHRWCTQWYGPLPAGRQGKGMGYRIDPDMLRVARGWLQVKDHQVRAAMLKALEKNPRDWVVVFGNQAETHYTVSEALRAIRAGIESRGSALHKTAISIHYVGEPHNGQVRR